MVGEAEGQTPEGEGEEILASGDAIIIANAIDGFGTALERGLIAIADAIRGEPEEESEIIQTYLDGSRIK